MYSKIDKFIQGFCKDSIRALKKEDKILKENFEKTRYKSFYSNFPKGIYFRSITEPTLKYIIFKELIKKYKMWHIPPHFISMAMSAESTWKNPDNTVEYPFSVKKN